MTGVGNTLVQSQVGWNNSASINLGANGSNVIQTQIGYGLHYSLSQQGGGYNGATVIITQTGFGH